METKSLVARYSYRIFFKFGNKGHDKYIFAIRTTLCLFDKNDYKIKFLNFVLIEQYPGNVIKLYELLLHVSAKISHFEVNFRYGTCL
jgi:hypothetical protein